ncbi:SusC/RagA family TonB-linked outer membrane protein [Ferruginibacter albus]|uniref:SusC/RagA family TonB-linked outer membrane protein n=1 Tax=Ferruginibacter albus TaxID=2875540 RepID=UPI001CC34AF4|nr:TonB-dependent receptor [Ferruginibacter albus]UAY53651.1 TonB-dependent receptor [Ferruginibacter albus]
MRKLLLVFLVSFCIPFTLLAQKTIKGKVTDENGSAAVGVNVSVKGNKKEAVQTDANGNFSLVVKETDNISLVFTSAEFESQTVSAGSGNVNVKMKTSVTTGNDVVVVGYQTMKKRELTAPVSSVGAKELKDVPITSVGEALNGRLAGVTATSSEGSPDAQIKIRVRGGGSITQDNSPLYIIDGVEVESGLSSLALQDIQSIDVLKDASSTAIYGARGANGVVIITTKSGKVGKPRITYNGSFGMKSIANELPVLNSLDYMDLQWERDIMMGTGTSGLQTFTKKYVGTYDSIALYVRDSTRPVDWQKQVMGRNALTTVQNLGISGGSKKLTYTGTYTYNNEQGIVFTSNNRKNIANVKLDYKPIKDLKMGISGKFSDQVVDGASTSEDGSASLNRLRNIIKYRPFLTPGETVESIDYGGLTDPDQVANGLGLVNPYVLMQQITKRKHQVTANASFYAQYNFLKHFNFRTTLGIDYTKIDVSNFEDSITSDSRINGANMPIIEMDSVTKKSFNMSNVLTWQLKNFKKVHDITVLVGNEIFNQDYEEHDNRRRNIPNGTTPAEALAQDTLGFVDVGRSFPFTYRAHAKLLSFFGKINYTYDDKYIFAGTLRTDGSSKFAPPSNLRWGTFPSVSLAWRVSKENFLKNVKWLTELKLRASYGQAGNNRIPDYLYITTYSQGNPYGLNNVSNPSLITANLSNYNLKWETNTSKNLGLDATFLNGRIDLTVDVYRNEGSDLLLAAPISPVLGYSQQIQNAGATLNKGVEVQLNITPVKTKNFTWTISLNNAWNTNTIERLTPGIDSVLVSSGWSGSGSNVVDFAQIVGKPVGSMWGYVSDGFYSASDFSSYVTPTGSGGNTYTPYASTAPGLGGFIMKPGVVRNNAIQSANIPGGIRFKDLNGDGVVDSKDQTIIGNPNPKFTGGINQQFTYKNFDMSIFINWSVGAQVMNANRVEFSGTYTSFASTLAIEKGRWKAIDGNGNLVTDLTQLASINQNATTWTPVSQAAGSANAFLLYSDAIEDASFLRFNNFTVGYTIPKKALKRLKIQSLRLYFTASNLAIITNYSGYDPEVSTRYNSSLGGYPTPGNVGQYPTPGVDYSAYPRSRSFLVGLNLAL